MPESSLTNPPMSVTLRRTSREVNKKTPVSYGEMRHRNRQGNLRETDNEDRLTLWVGRVVVAGSWASASAGCAWRRVTQWLVGFKLDPYGCGLLHCTRLDDGSLEISIVYLESVAYAVKPSLHASQQVVHVVASLVRREEQHADLPWPFGHSLPDRLQHGGSAAHVAILCYSLRLGCPVLPLVGTQIARRPWQADDHGDAHTYPVAIAVALVFCCGVHDGQTKVLAAWMRVPASTCAPALASTEPCSTVAVPQVRCNSFGTVCSKLPSIGGVTVASTCIQGWSGYQAMSMLTAHSLIKVLALTLACAPCSSSSHDCIGVLLIIGMPPHAEIGSSGNWTVGRMHDVICCRSTTRT